MAVTLYQSYIRNDPAIEESVKQWRKDDVEQAGLASFQDLKWTPDVRVQGLLPNPLEFLNIKLVAKQVAHPAAEDAVRLWLDRQTRFHELRHLYDFRRGRFYHGARVFNSWEEWDSKANVWSIAHEVDGRLVEAHHALVQDKQRELSRFVTLLMAPTKSRTLHLIAYNLLDLMISHIAQDPSRYRGIRLFPHSKVSLRGQILAQLDALTPAELDRVWNAVMAAREIHPLDLKMPRTVSIKDLVEGPVPPMTGAQRILPWTPAGIGVSIAAGTAASLYRVYATRRAIRRSYEMGGLRQQLAKRSRAVWPEETLKQFLDLLSSPRQLSAELRKNDLPLKPAEISSLIKQIRQDGERGMNKAGRSKSLKIKPLVWMGFILGTLLAIGGILFLLNDLPFLRAFASSHWTPILSVISILPMPRSRLTASAA